MNNKTELGYTINFEVWGVEREKNQKDLDPSIYFMAATESNNIAHGIAQTLYDDRSKLGGRTNYAFVVYSTNRKINLAPSGVYMTPMTDDSREEMKSLISLVEQERVY